jgi:hypothetical protein
VRSDRGLSRPRRAGEEDVHQRRSRSGASRAR